MCRSMQASSRHTMALQPGSSQGRISSTPSFLINGIPMSGARNLEAFSQIIDEEIARNSSDGSKATDCGA